MHERVGGVGKVSKCMRGWGVLVVGQKVSEGGFKGEGVSH